MSVQMFNPTDLSQSAANWVVAQRIVGSFAPHAQVTPNMTVAVDPGHLLSGAALLEVNAQSVGPLTPPASDFRVDRIVIDRTTGTASAVTGAVGSTTPPAIPAGTLPVARVFLANATTQITNDAIVDERALADLTAPYTPTVVICRADLNGADQTGVALHPTNVKVLLSHAAVDVGSSFDAANNRFKPTVAGYYLVYAQLAMNMTSGTWQGVILKKTGASSGFAYGGASSASSNRVHSTVQDVVYLDGVNDYVEMFASQTVSSSGTFLGGVVNTFFVAQKIG